MFDLVKAVLGKGKWGVGAPTTMGLSLWKRSMEGGDSLWGLNHGGAPAAA